MEITKEEPASVMLERETRIAEQSDAWLTESRDFIDRLKQLYGFKSDSEVARFLRVSFNTVYRYRSRNSRFDDNIALKVAAALRAKDDNVTDGYVLVCMARERSRLKVVKEAWRQVAKTVFAAARPLP